VIHSFPLPGLLEACYRLGSAVVRCHLLPRAMIPLAACEGLFGSASPYRSGDRALCVGHTFSPVCSAGPAAWFVYSKTVTFE